MTAHTPAPQLVILLAEDEPADAHLFRLALKENHVAADVQHVVDGREALEYLRRQGLRFAAAVRPDLILLDLNLPRMDGREFLAAIKEDGELREIPVVVLSTSRAERDVVAAYRLGAAGYLAKSPDVTEFIRDIRKLTTYWGSVVRLPERQ
ncbi:response regulator [Accumulibacter sp.]|uniref:response regulator n=1 Tax=Accumulibacter sp. TaxID=2053492 RepID=UPI0025FB8879|nr:response regulator [Accumulibacter sp.]MCM8596965.1 response regulator [Accumulibacter sp.]MCM8624459.1 response regulator [Accumulibacter sp.]MDS4051114.1 response regulator [Accumulibacter sp.]